LEEQQAGNMLSRKTNSRNFDSCHLLSPMASFKVKRLRPHDASLYRLCGTLAEQYESCGCCKETYLSTEKDCDIVRETFFRVFNHVADLPITRI